MYNCHTNLVCANICVFYRIQPQVPTQNYGHTRVSVTKLLSVWVLKKHPCKARGCSINIDLLTNLLGHPLPHLVFMTQHYTTLHIDINAVLFNID